jgi:hypothetical protein
MLDWFRGCPKSLEDIGPSIVIDNNNVHCFKVRQACDCINIKRPSANMGVNTLKDTTVTISVLNYVQTFYYPFQHLMMSFVNRIALHQKCANSCHN